MQMGRWFGYRKNYDDLFRIWTHKSSARWYAEIAEATDKLKDDMTLMRDLGQRPRDFGIRVRNNSAELSITAYNKMRNATDEYEFSSYFGGIVETPYLFLNTAAHKNNYSAVQQLVKDALNNGATFERQKNAGPKGHYIIQNIPKTRIVDLIRKLRISRFSSNFDTKQIADFLENCSDKSIDLFDIAFMEGSPTTESDKIVTLEGRSIPKVLRTNCILDKDTDRLGIGQRGKLGGPGDGRTGVIDFNGFEAEQIIENAKEKYRQEYKRAHGYEFTTGKTYPSDTWFKFIKDRKPILLVYFIDVDVDAEESNQKKQINKFREEMNGIPAVGFALGLPQNEDAARISGTKYKNNDKYRTLIRSELDYFSIMDTIITIGENFAPKLESVNNNSIPERYKLTSTYDEYIAAQPVRGRNLLSAFPYKIEVEDKDGNAANIDFAISGWMGTVSNLPDLRLLEKETDDEEDEDRITINDNRISLYSRGKLGEYDILSKIKNNRNSEAYVIGELYVDIFEQDGLADMAISNRRGYEENDPRYIEVIKIAKRLLGYIVGQKDIVSKRRKEDDQRIEDEKIKKKFWENPQTREILELRLNDAEKQVVQEENLQFTRAVNNGKQTKKIFISHKEVHKLYGQFIVDVLETYGVDVVSTIIFTGDRRLGVPQGKDIYDYLKDCFREDLMVIFLFSKAFYDSNICISEAGAAWATNQNCMNVVIDISFSDIEKPSNNALSSIKFQQIRTPDQTITVTEFFKTIIEEGLHLEYDESKLQKALNDVLETDKYSDQKIDFPATFLPKRKFLPVPRCSKCHNIMLLTEENGRLKYVCSNVSCDECYEAVIN